MIVWLNPTAGLSGDMLLGALLDLGAPLAAVSDAVASTGLTGWRLDVVETRRLGLRAAHARVQVEDEVSERSAAVLLDLAARAQPAPVATIAVAAVRALAEVEAGIHGVAVEDVHLHEIGGIDTIVDTVGVAAALHALDVTELWSAPLALGAGQTDSAHGRLPVPAPATLALLAGVPVVGSDTGMETVTPTGAALLRAAGCRYGPVPAMTVLATGYGAGSRDTPGRPNVLPAVLGTAPDPAGLEAMIVLESTVDDLTGEVLGQLVDRLLEAGAADAWLAPVLGKKGRPAHVVTALCHDGDRDRVETALLRETGTLGVRRTPVQRRALPRTTGEILVDGRPIRTKSGPHRTKPEYEDLLAAARAAGRPVRELGEQAQREL